MGCATSKELQWWRASQGEIDRELHELNHDTEKVELRQLVWQVFGQELEPALRSGAIALLDARWLVNFALSGKDAVLPCRQELPPEAFLSCDQVIGSTEISMKRILGPRLHIVVLSHMWLHPSHPDPKGSTLQLLATWCRKLFMWHNDDACPRWGVFWDYASLHQHPDAKRGILRTEQEDKLFREGLRASSKFYSHSETTVFRVRKFPRNYPAGYDLPSETNCAPYDQRGWPLVESSLATVAAGRLQLFDICQKPKRFYFKSKVERLAPLTPERMWERLQTASFTNAKADRPLLLELYRANFVKHFGQTKEMDYFHLGWDDEQIVNLAEIIGAGYCPQLQKLNLSGTCVGVEGCRALANALSRPQAPQLTTVTLGFATPCDEGVRILSEHLVQIEEVDLGIDQLGVGACQALSEAASKRGKTSLKMRSLTIQIGNEGVAWLAPLLVQHLEDVNLERCNVGKAGCEALAKAAAQQEHMMQIEEVDLGNDQLGVDACQALSEAASKRGKTSLKMRSLNLGANRQIGNKGVAWLAPLLMQHLEDVNLRCCNVGKAGCEALATAAAQHAPCPMKKLSLMWNPGISVSGCLAHIVKLVQCCPYLEELVLDKRLGKRRVERALNASKAKTTKISFE